MANSLPGISVEVAKAQPLASPLRTDVAGMVGRTLRGPVGERVRVAGWRAFQAVFGGLGGDLTTPYAVRAYFENGGEVLHFVRVAGEGIAHAFTTWSPATSEGRVGRVFDGSVAGTGLLDTYRIAAKSPGTWAAEMRIEVVYRRWGRHESSGTWRPELDVHIAPVSGPTEQLIGIAASQLAEEVTRRSRYVTMTSPSEGSHLHDGAPSSLRWKLTLTRPDAGAMPNRRDYRAALQTLLDEPEVALMALPDIHELPPDDVVGCLRETIRRADAQLDRMVILDPPPWAVEHDEIPDPLVTGDIPVRLATWATSLQPEGVAHLRSAALYFPYLEIVDPRGTLATPLRRVPPSGHVAGVVSRLDRERGAHHSPANARIVGAIGVAAGVDVFEQGRLFRRGTNLLRCHPRDGLTVWGARTLVGSYAEQDRDPAHTPGLFLAHRRLLHRLVRAIRHVAEPLVFETNGPMLWLAFGRAVTTVLMSAYRAGALQGDRVEQAFRIKCDEETNPPTAIDNGMCLCRIKIAPVVPMEFIEIQVALSRDGALEVIEP